MKCIIHPKFLVTIIAALLNTACDNHKTANAQSATPAPNPAQDKPASPPTPPTKDTYENWAAFLKVCSHRSEEIDALRHLLPFYDSPKADGSSRMETKKTFEAPEGEFTTYQNGVPSHPIGSLLTLTMMVTGEDNDISVTIHAKLVMVGKRVMLFKDSDNRWFASWNQEQIIPLIKEKEIPPPPATADKNQQFLEHWRLSTFLKFNQKLVNPSFTAKMNPALYEFLSELPIPECKELLTKMPEDTTDENKAARESALSQWPKTIETITKAEAPVQTKGTTKTRTLTIESDQRSFSPQSNGSTPSSGATSPATQPQGTNKKGYSGRYVGLILPKGGGFLSQSKTAGMGQYMDRKAGLLYTAEKTDSITDTSVLLTTSGSAITFKINAATEVFDQDKKIKPSDIKAGDIITVVTKPGDDVAVKIKKGLLLFSASEHNLIDWGFDLKHLESGYKYNPTPEK